jgi:membrane protein
MIASPRLRDLTLADWRAIVVRAGKELLADNASMLASALAYNAFFAIPSVLLLVVGVYTLTVGPQTITSLMQRFDHVMPAEATSLLGSSLKNLTAHPAQGVLMVVLGLVFALWSTTGAMTSFMTAINIAYDRKDSRSFIRKRLVALKMVVAVGVALLLVAVFLIFGPPIEHVIATHAGDAGSVVGWVWWTAQWPILLFGLLAAFATLLYLGPDIERLRWTFFTPGALVAALIWIASSGAFAVYTATFGSYNKTWGTLSAVIVTLTWLWLSAMALLLGAEINAEAQRTERLRSAR